jgi:hypothetical protein
VTKINEELPIITGNYNKKKSKDLGNKTFKAITQRICMTQGIISRSCRLRR